MSTSTRRIQRDADTLITPNPSSKVPKSPQLRKPTTMSTETGEAPRAMAGSPQANRWELSVGGKEDLCTQALQKQLDRADIQAEELEVKIERLESENAKLKDKGSRTENQSAMVELIRCRIRPNAPAASRERWRGIGAESQASAKPAERRSSNTHTLRPIARTNERPLREE